MDEQELLCNEAHALHLRLLAAHWNLRAAGEVIRAERAQRAAERARQRYWRRAYRWEEAQVAEAERLIEATAEWFVDDEMDKIAYDSGYDFD